VARRLAQAVAAAVLAVVSPLGPAGPARAEPAPPGLEAPTLVVLTASTLEVRVPVDTHGSDTTVSVEYVTAGAYRPGARRVPSAAITVVIATVAGSEDGPVLVTGRVTGLEPATSYRMRVKAASAGGETLGSDLELRTPAAPKISFKAKVVAGHETKLTKLKIAGLIGHETTKITCKTPGRGCPLAGETLTDLGSGTVRLLQFRGATMQPGAKVTIQVTSDGTRLSRLTLTMRDGRQPKVRRG
jgi:hypothetical protein